MRPCLQLLSGLLLGLALACSGSSDHGTATPATPAVPAASGFTYTAPAGTGWRLVEDAASTPTRLLLDLVGPAGTLSRGVGFNLKAATGVRFGTFGTAGSPVSDAGVYELLSADPTYLYEPSLLGGGVKPGNLLTVGIFQKDRRFGAKDSGTALCQIALVFDAAAGLHKAMPWPSRCPRPSTWPGTSARWATPPGPPTPSTTTPSAKPIWSPWPWPWAP